MTLLLNAILGTCFGSLVGILSLAFVHMEELAYQIGTVIIFSICGLILGILYAKHQKKKELDLERELQQRQAEEEARLRAIEERKQKEYEAEQEKKYKQKLAGELKTTISGASNTCNNNIRSEKDITATSYKANEKLAEIIENFMKIEEIKGKVDFVIQEIEKVKG